MTSTINDNLPLGATELDLDDLNGLIPSYINTRNDLDEFEKINISKAIAWLRRKNYKYKDILTMSFLFELHTKMFDKTWKWAGTLRQRAVNIGNTPTEQIQMKVKNVLDNTIFWIEYNIFPIDEICIRLHYELVWIHPFPNGNGRFCRIICDELHRSFGYSNFSWGRTNGDLISASQSRKKYIVALRKADENNFESLIKFAKSDI